MGEKDGEYVGKELMEGNEGGGERRIERKRKD